ncbi:MAG TPA: hypothetical protein VGI26_08370 [Solirubrobacteraceae bacterium]
MSYLTAPTHPQAEALDAPATGPLRMLAAMVAISCCLALSFAASARAAAQPVWSVAASSQATNFVAGTTPADSVTGSFPQYLIEVTNAGGSASSGTVTITDTLPAGITPQEADLLDAEGNEYFTCTIAGQKVTCTYDEPLQPGELLRAYISVEVEASASGSVSDQAMVSGGGAADASTNVETAITEAEPSFGFLSGLEGFGASATEPDGTAATQAGAHPYDVTVSTGFPTSAKDGTLVAVGHLRDIKVDLPSGLVVNPTATPVRCTETQLESDLEAREGSGCPLASQIGVIGLTAVVSKTTTQDVPLYNMVPPAGKPAEFGFDAADIGLYVHLMGGVDVGSGYALAATANDIDAKLVITGVQATLWGNPTDPSHDHQRGECATHPFRSTCPASIQRSSIPLLSLPSSCGSSLGVSASADSWEQPGEFKMASAQLGDLSGNPTSIGGCSKLDFTPSITVSPDTSVADSPSGLHVDLKVPQSESMNTLASANLKKAVVTLPAGMSVSPSAASGLVGCSEAQIALHSSSPAGCPDASKVGSVEVTTPLLGDVLKGGLFIAQQGDRPGNGSNPFGSLLAIYVTAEADGAVVKLAGKVQADPVTGQLTTTFDENPQLPFSDFKLDFFGGQRGALATPEACGTYSTQSALSPWSGTPAVQLSDSFAVSSGCVNGFSPSFVAGIQNPQAGSYSPFVLSFSRSDTDQEMSGLSVKLPEGVLAKLAGVPLCSDAALAAAVGESGASEQAQPSCPAGSQVGSVTAVAGPGPAPFSTNGKVYLTGPYKGAPYGFAVIVPAVAGPYDLGSVVVRQGLYVDPSTAQVTAVSDPFPTILDGIPLRLRRIDVTVDKPQFVINPTSCEPMQVTGTLTSTGGVTVPVASRFQTGGCSSLAFKPVFSASTESKAAPSGTGASLTVRLAYPSGQANIHNVEVQLPRLMPSRLTTLQKACREQVFAENPADCPIESNVGSATANTPLLAKPLQGPAYLVSHGGAAFPDLEVVLQGEGITLILDGKTEIKNGITYSRFQTTPDAPVNSFTLNLPKSTHSALGVPRGHNLCMEPLTMPTRIVAQNGAETKQNTRIEVTGCPNTITILHHTIKGHTLTLKVGVPRAGRLAASGKGLTSTGKTTNGGQTVTLRLKETNPGALSTNVLIRFTPNTGKQRKILRKTIRAAFR